MWKSITIVASSAVFSAIGLAASHLDHGNAVIGAVAGTVAGFIVGYLAVVIGVTSGQSK